MRKPLLLALSLLGLFDSTYLLWVYTSPSSPMICLGGGTGCDTVRASSYSHLFGVPLPAFGVLMYVTLALLILAESLVAAGLAKLIRYVATGIAGAGFLFSLYLSGIEAFVLRAWCTWCMISAGSVTLIFALALSVTVRAEPHPEPQAALVLVRRYFAICVAALVAGTPAFYYLVRSQTLPPPATASPETLLQRLIRPDSHATGNPQAPVTVVEFADFQCAPCELAEPTVRKIRARYGNQIRFVFRHFPLESIHPQAQEAAEASECAAEQGKFWEAAEKLFQRQADLSVPALKRCAGELGLDVTRFSQCLASGETAARVRRDLEDGRALGVRATPTFFVGRKMIEGLIELAEFSRLVEQELGRAGTTVAPARMQPTSPVARMGSMPSTAPGSLGNRGVGFFTQLQSSPLGCSEEDASQPEPRLIGTPEARQLFEASPRALFVDVRQPKEFESGRIRGAINLPLDKVEKPGNNLPKDRSIVLYESGESSGDVCAASRAAGRVLLRNGFSTESVRVYQDGLAGWEKAGLPVER
jgi:protein-disulfide isomerase/rhodanese-related sulfurtransferase